MLCFVEMHGERLCRDTELTTGSKYCEIIVGSLKTMWDNI